MAYQLQDVAANPAYSIDWTDWLASADAVASHVWAISPSGPIVADLGESLGIVSAQVSDVLFGKIYRLSCDIVTTAGESGVRSIVIRGGHR